jgi:hypothetical protein
MGCGLLAALGTTALGAGLDYAGGQQSKNAMNNVVNSTIGRENQFTNQAQGVFNNSLAQSTPKAAQQQMGQGQQQLGGLISQAQNVPASFSMPSFGATNTAQQGVRQGLSNQAAQNMAGYQTYGIDQAIKDLQANSQLGVIGNEAQSAASIMPVQLQQASQRGQPLQAAGGLLGSLGELGGLYNLTGNPRTNLSSANALPLFGSNQAPFYSDYGYIGNQGPWGTITNSLIGG